MNFIDFNTNDLQNIIDTDHLIALLLNRGNMPSIEALSHVVNHHKMILDNIKLVALYIKLLKSNNKTSSEFRYHWIIENFIKNTFDTNDIEYNIEGLSAYDVFEELGAFPFFIQNHSISTLQEATSLLNTYGENTFPDELLDFVKENVLDSDTTSNDWFDDEDLDYDDLEDELYDSMNNWSFEPCSVPAFKYKECTLSPRQIDFIVSVNNYNSYNWHIRTFYSPELHSFIMDNLENTEKMNQLLSLARQLVEASATNLSTVTNFEIVNLGVSNPCYGLECLVFQNLLELPDLVPLDWVELRGLYKVNEELKILLSCNED